MQLFKKKPIIHKNSLYLEFQAVAIAKIHVQSNLMVIGVYDVEHVLACFDSCLVASYSKLVLDWLESLNSTVDQLLIVGLDGLVGQRLQLQQLKMRKNYIGKYIFKLNICLEKFV